MSATRPSRPGTSTPAVRGLDPRGPQFSASVTAALLVVVLLTAPGAVAVVLLAVQAALFALGAVGGVDRLPTAWVFKRLVRPRLRPSAELEDPEPPRFAQAVGLAFTVVGLVGFVTGLDVVGLVAVGAALAAALLNAVFRFCLGCEVYLLLRRATHA